MTKHKKQYARGVRYKVDPTPTTVDERAKNLLRMTRRIAALERIIRESNKRVQYAQQERNLLKRQLKAALQVGQEFEFDSADKKDA